MYGIEDLFDRQSTVGARLEAVLEEKGYTKVKFCRAAGISRPTLDKLLAGSITSRTNYEKHMAKVLDSLNMTPDMLLGKAHDPRVQNQVRTLRNQMRLKEKELAEYIGVPIDRIREIEAGEEATLAELRDIAVILHTSVRELLEKNYFPLQNELWGHIGIRPLSSDIFLWYPITAESSKVLLLNMNNIAEIILLDEASDTPSFTNWDEKVDCGEMPLVLYEALNDYLMYKEMDETPPEEIISGKLMVCLEHFAKEWEDEESYYWTGVKIYDPKGQIKEREIYFGEDENISTSFFHIYTYGEDALDEKFLYGDDGNGAELFFNIESISVIEAPLLKLEEALEKAFDEE